MSPRILFTLFTLFLSAVLPATAVAQLVFFTDPRQEVALRSNEGVTGSAVEITVWNGPTSFTSPFTTLTNQQFLGPIPSYPDSMPFSSFSGADSSDFDRQSNTLKGNPADVVEFSNFNVVVPEPAASLLIFISGMLGILRRRKIG